jgi:hypothetical protein
MLKLYVVGCNVRLSVRLLLVLFLEEKLNLVTKTGVFVLEMFYQSL